MSTETGSMRFFNTLTRRKEKFTPMEKGRVRMYTCGPTVYNYAHIGNFRAFLFEDLLKRWLEYCGYTVTHVMNLTDVDDKTIRGSQKQKIPLEQYTEHYANAFFEEIKALKQKSRTFIFSLSLFTFSVVWFLLSVQVVAPHFNAEGVYMHAGKFFPDLMQLKLPFDQLLFAIEDKYLYALLLFIPLQFLPFLSPATLAITLPTWAITFLSMHFAL